MVLICSRWAFVTLLLACFARKQIADAWPLLRPSWKSTAAMAACGLTLFNALFYVSARYTTALNIGIIQGCTPIIVLLGSFLLYKTRIRTLQLFGALCTIIGILIVAGGGSLISAAGISVNMGDFLMLLACCLSAGYTLSLVNRPQVSSTAFFSMLAGAAFVTSLPLLSYEVVIGAAIWPTGPGWAILLFVAVFPSFLSQIFFIRAVEIIGAARASIFANLVPVFSSVLAIGILDEQFAPSHIIALGLVVGGIFVAEQGSGSPGVSRPAT